MFAPRSIPLLLAMVSMVIVAGCLSTGTPAGVHTTTTPSGDETGGTTTTTGAPVTAFPPGIDASGIVDFEALADTHEDVLLEDGAVVTWRNEVLGPGDTVEQRSEVTYTIGPDGTLVGVTGIEREGAAVRAFQDIFINETTQTVRRTTDESVEYTVRPRTTEAESVVWGNLPWYVAQHADSLRVIDDDTSNGETVLQATLDRSPGVPGNDTTVEMRVTEAGVVSGFESRQQLAGGESSYVTTFRVEQVGGVEVIPPSWLEEVPASASLIVYIFAGMGESGALELEHTGGLDAIPAGTLVTIATEDRSWEAVLSWSVAPGESVFVSLDTDSRLQVSSVDPEPGDMDQLPAAFTVRVITTDEVVLFEESLGWMPAG